VMPPMTHLMINVGVAAMAVLIATPGAAREHCPDPPPQTEAIVSVETDIFSALENEDKVSWERLTDRDFVAFEGAIATAERISSSWRGQPMLLGGTLNGA